MSLPASRTAAAADMSKSHKRLPNALVRNKRQNKEKNGKGAIAATLLLGGGNF